MDWRRLDLEAIGQALSGMEAAQELTGDLPEEPLTEDAVRRMVAGYRYVDDLLAARTDIFCYGETRHILELNHLVLCGTTPERRAQYQKHIDETQRRFYERSGIGDFMEWYKRNRTGSPQALASGVFLRVLSSPQLFIEGNSRTATLLVSYVRVRAGLAPLVVTVDMFRRYVGMVERCTALDRTGFASLFTGVALHRRLTEFLADACDERFVMSPPDENGQGAERWTGR